MYISTFWPSLHIAMVEHLRGRTSGRGSKQPGREAVADPLTDDAEEASSVEESRRVTDFGADPIDLPVL